ncbi:hypothetical protein [Pseudomonas sp. UMAB-40]|uniref:hypothetical protein n=1 Tax=Pseudomonas sp. UMAB-40 TaxID=1365407 RepID=UPI001C5718AC|nr:hypothetical protein [Pseudomonas sp. UMAB-40]
MKYISPVNTRRVSVEMSELLIEDVEKLCEIPAIYEQRTASELLRRVCKPIDRPGAVADPRFWSVNERIFVIGNYMAATRSDGPDFPVGDETHGGHFSDYLLAGADYVADIPFTFDGITWLYSPLLGYQAEVIEALIAGGAYKATDFSWWCAAMAACLRAADEEPVVYVDDASYEAALVERITPLRKLAESQFVGLFHAFLDAQQQAAHLVHAITSSFGVVAAPVSERAEGAPELAPACFPAHTCISRGARAVMGIV